MPLDILVSAGEVSSDRYAAMLVEELRRRWPDARFFGSAGPRMRQAGVEPVIQAESLAVVGILEVVTHLPRIRREFRKLVDAVRARRPHLAILTDSPDFHLRVARKLKAEGIPVVYLVAPQVWAWRKGRISLMRRTIDRLLCIFPFEEAFFRKHGLQAWYVGHPLAGRVQPTLEKAEFFRKHRLVPSRQLVTVLPGSRKGEAARHLGPLIEAVERIYRAQATHFILPASETTGAAFFRERIGPAPIQVIEGEAWDAIAHADLALAASGTVTVEAALAGTPMVTYYKVNPLSWLLGRCLVRVPFYSMVNLVAERAIVPELMQSQMTAERLAANAIWLLGDETARKKMRADLAEVARKLSCDRPAMERAAALVEELMEGQAAHVS
ncbi:MAG TPA: lipid-A-disaccharide synthase [Bryobacteraceae bacterium]|nr:lipid-A-disaccharide synthase [Bryobacteraceae bacterium]